MTQEFEANVKAIARREGNVRAIPDFAVNTD